MTEENKTNSESAYAIVRVGSHSHKVALGDRVVVEWSLTGNNKESGIPSEIVFEEVLLSKPESGTAVVGTPLVEGATVTGKVIGTKSGEKLTSYKKTRRQGFHKKKGHRQTFVEVEIASIP